MSLRTRIVGRLALFALIFGLWLVAAGRLVWPQAWAFMALFLGFAVTLSWRLSLADPDLLRERMRPDAEAEPWDRRLIRVYVGLMVGLLLVAAFDTGRFGWSLVPGWVQAVGWGLMAVCGGLVWHVTFANPYLSRHARLQPDRGHTVVREGLYAHLRHPMYLGLVLLFLGLPLALSSWVAFAPAIAIIGLFVYRTLREDRMLREGLPGYAEYAAEVRYRLMPGVW